MRFYTGQHTHYCGVDLHTKTMYLCILGTQGQVLLQRNMLANPTTFLKAIEPFREGLVVAAECIFTWYWLADLCQREDIPFVLGHALYMKAIHGGKTKNDKGDAHKIATLLRGGMLPMGYVYPKEKRSTRDLLRRRTYFVRKRAELLAHIQNTSWQYRLEPIGRRLAGRTNREEILELFDDKSVQSSVALDLELITFYDKLIRKLERELTRMARIHDRPTYDLIRSIPGVGKVLTLLFLYEIDDITRFNNVGQFCSYARLIRPVKTSAKKKVAAKGNKKIGNAHLKWAFSEATLLLIRTCQPVKARYEKLIARHGKGKALGILSHKLGRTFYYMNKRKEYFNMDQFLAT